MKVRRGKWLWFWAYVWLALPLAAQDKWRLAVRPLQATDAPILARKGYAPHHPDSASALAELARLVDRLHARAYLLASADSLLVSGKQVAATLYIGLRYRWLALRTGNLPDWVAQKTSFKEKFFNNTPLRYAHYLRLREEVIEVAENNGYPFASVGLDSIEIDGGSLSAVLRYEPGTYIRFDSVVVQGAAKVKPSFLRGVARWNANEPFSQQRALQAVRTLRQLPYLGLARPPEVLFKNDRAYLLINTVPVRASQFDGIVGLLPNQERPGQVLLTGQVNLRLQNLFNSGKMLHLEWQRLRTASQVFNAAYEHPNLLNTRLDVGAKFNLLKEDSTFLNIGQSLRFALPVHASGRGGLGKVLFFARLNSTTVTDTSRRGNSAQALLANTRFASYGLGYDYTDLDQPLRPQSGWLLRAEGGLGNKRARPRGPSPNDTSQTSLVPRSVQWFATVQASRFVRTGKSTTLLLRLQGGLLQGRQLFLNELFRLGGLASLRGFNENTFFASTYGVLTAEYRLYFERESFLFAFTDQGFWQYSLSGPPRRDAPLGLGAGMNLATKGGTFAFVFALGRSAFPEQRFSINQAKIHFGYISRF